MFASLNALSGTVARMGRRKNRLPNRLSQLRLEQLERRELLSGTGWDAGSLDPTFGTNGSGYFELSPDTGIEKLLQLETGTGDLITVGYNNVSRFDLQGNTIWSTPVDGGFFNSGVLDSQGNLYIAGSTQRWVWENDTGSWQGADFVIRRLDIATGTIDSQFGDSGLATVDILYREGLVYNGTTFLTRPQGSSGDIADSIMLDNDGNIVVIGHSYTFNMREEGFNQNRPVYGLTAFVTAITAARLTPAGVLDTTFGREWNGARDGTLVSYGFDTGNRYYEGFREFDYTPSVYGTIDASNGLILVGQPRYGDGERERGPTLQRFTDTGVQDTSFGVAGFASVDFFESFSGGTHTWVRSMAFTSDASGNLLLAVGAEHNVDEQELSEWYSTLSLAKFNAQGTMDLSFGSDGNGISASFVTLTGTNDPAKQADVEFAEDWLRELTVDSQGRLILSGWSYIGSETTEYDTILVRYTSDGLVDESFNSGEKHLHAFEGSQSVVVAANDDLYMLVYDPALVKVLGEARSVILDADGDGIEDQVDVAPDIVSAAFLDSLTFGSIQDRGDQILTITDSPISSEGVVIKASSAGGAAPAIVEIENGAAYLTLNAGDEVVVSHGSVVVHVLAGVVEALFVASSGQRGTAELLQDTIIEFKPESFTFVSPESNTNPVQVIGEDGQLVIQPGETATMIEIDVKPTDPANTINLSSNGTITVALFGNSGISGTQISTSSIRFAGASASHSTLEDLNGDGIVDLIVQFRTQDTDLRSLYEQLLTDDLDGDGVLDSSLQTLKVDLSAQTVDEVFLSGSDDVDLFLAGKALRTLLDQLFAE